MTTSLIAGVVCAGLGIALITNVFGISDRLGEYGRRQREQKGLMAPGMVSGDQVRGAGWMLLVVSPVLFVAALLSHH